MRRTLRFLSSCLFALSPSLVAQQDTLWLNGLWRFTPGDSSEFSAPSFVDTGWTRIRADRIWEEQGYEKLDGYAWFRLRVFIPSSVRTRASVQNGLRICLGKINNFDQSYLNGALIGINGKMVSPGSPPDSTFIRAETILWNHERIYVLPFDDPRIRWDAENVFAIRVYDEGGQGGLWSGTAHVRSVSITDLVRLDHDLSVFRFGDRGLTKTFSVRNVSDSLVIHCILNARAINELTGAVVYQRRYPFELYPGQVDSFTVALPAPQQTTSIRYSVRFLDYPGVLSSQEAVPYILTPPTPRAPRINGPAVVGTRDGRPFLFLVPATGARPMTFKAKGLPRGLKLDPRTGIVSGRPTKRGSFSVALQARNSYGSTRRTITFQIGDKLALTPPMGWNSWNVWGLTVDQDKVLASARVFKEKGLAEHAWSFINIDDGWEIKGDSPSPKRDEAGNILVNEKFPNMKALGDSLHSLGLKFGIYSSPGPLTCGGYTASYGYELQDARSYASWGVDYLKYDWCSYGNIAKDTSRAELMKPYTLMRKMLDKVDRDIVYSLCQYGMGNVWEWGALVGGDLWRTTGDITDTWESMSGIGFYQVASAPYAGPGHWNDPDMLVVGWVGWGPNLHPTKLTPDEQYTHISLWCLLSAPLLIGCDLTRLDPFTVSLLTNDEVLAVDQDPLGKQATPALVRDSIQVWTKDLSNGTKAVGVFNLGSGPRTVQLQLAEIGLPGSVHLRDLWRGKSLGVASTSFEVTVSRHGVVLLKTAK